MESTDIAESFSSSSSYRCRYDVFLSFRGEDTRTNFADHLYAALTEAKLHVFRDDDEIESGKNIEYELERAIDQSRICIVIFSKNYASSRWCLDELVRILHRKKTAGQEVLSVFYDVSPSAVRKQTAAFQKAFEEHEVRFKNGENEKKGLERMQQWRSALREAADLGGFVLENQADKHEARFIKNHILPAVMKKMEPELLLEPPHLIGADEQLRHINSWLQEGSTEVSILAICGMSGIGKTTIAKAIYNLNYKRFSARSFLENIRETSKQFNGLVLLQRRLLSKIFVGVKPEIDTVDEGIAWITKALCCSRVLLVLDDVDQEDELDAILRLYKSFYPGSKIIITTTNESLMRGYSMSKLHIVELLEDKQSLELFSWHAFGQSHPSESYMHLSRRVVNYCGGMPLALKVLGSALRCSDPNIWESALEQFEAIPHGKITERLKLSYDTLPDERQKHLFLDIACFFVGKDKDYVRLILEKCELSPAYGFKILMERCLLTVNAHNELMMHQLLKDMGREIVRQESTEDPGDRSRVWRHRDSFNVLKDTTGSKKVRGLSLDLRLLNKEDTDLPAGKEAISFKFRSDAFMGMQRLRLLQLNYVQLAGGFQFLSKEMRWLCWHGFPLKSIPNDFYLEKVVALDMRNSELQYAFRGIKFLGSLKVLNVSHSYSLIMTPDFFGAPNLEKIILKFCKSLIEIHESITKLKRLAILNLKGCAKLRKLPEQIHQLESLRQLIVSGCSNLKILPKDLGKMPLLEVLRADEINQSPVFRCTGLPIVLQQIILFFLSKLKIPPTALMFPSLPQALTRLSMKQCNISDNVLPSNIGSLSTLQCLNLALNPFRSLPKSINQIMKLLHLDIRGCDELQSLPELPGNMEYLNIAKCKSLERLTNLPNLFTSLNFQGHGCPKIAEVQNMFRIEPLEKVDEEIMENLGLGNVKSFKNQKVALCNLMTRETNYYPLQGLYEFGIFSIFLPGTEIPNWFNNDRRIRFSIKEHSPIKDQVISFTVPLLPNLKLQGLNIGVVYSSSNKSLYSHVINKTKDKGWVYSPTFLMVVDVDEGFVWLSNWSTGHQLEAGDEVSICLSGTISKIEIQLLYYEQEQEHYLSTQPKTRLSLQNLIEGGHLSTFQLSQGRYFLCHYHYKVFHNPVMSINSIILKWESEDESLLRTLNFFFNRAMFVNFEVLKNAVFLNSGHQCLSFIRVFFVILALDDINAPFPRPIALKQFATVLSKCTLDPSSSSFQFDIAKMSKALQVESVGTMLSWLTRCPAIFDAARVAMELYSLFPDVEVPQSNYYAYEMLDNVIREIEAYLENPQPRIEDELALRQNVAPVLIEVLNSKQKVFAIIVRLMTSKVQFYWSPIIDYVA